MSTSAAQNTAREMGRARVMLELEGRGWAVRTGQIGQRPVLHAERDGVRRTILMSAKRSGTWQTSTAYGAEQAPEETRGRLWVFVDLGRPASEFFIVPVDWMVEDIWQVHQQYLKQHGGQRKVTRKSTHHKIELARIEDWRDRWDLLDGASAER